jgi:hypothetical protein
LTIPLQQGGPIVGIDVDVVVEGVVSLLTGDVDCAFDSSVLVLLSSEDSTDGVDDVDCAEEKTGVERSLALNLRSISISAGVGSFV